MIYYLYKITVGGKSYIGTAINPPKRWRQHARAKTSIGRAIRKCGLSRAVFKVIGKRRTVKAIYALERATIAQLKTRAPRGHNIAEGGNGWPGGPHSKQWHISMAEVGKRNARNPKWCASHAAVAQRRRGKCTPAHAATMRRIGLAKRGKPWSAARRAAGQPRHWSAARRVAHPQHYAQRTFT
jgi:hypothetical protein